MPPRLELPTVVAAMAHSPLPQAADTASIPPIACSCVAWVAAVAFMLVSAMHSQAATHDIDPAAREEANLLAVTFIDPDRGWAVGERGTILHTEDGGVHWAPQPSPTQRTLTDIAMYNSQRGLAIGGTYNAHTQLSAGEVMITKDGGQTWHSNTPHDLPRLRKLLIGPGGKCIAVGDWSPVQSTSVFASDDGGQTWQPRDCDIAGCMVGLAGEVDDFLVLSDRGEVVRFQSNGRPERLFSTDEDWQLLAGRQGDRLLIGRRVAIVSKDNGGSWHVIPRSADSPALISAGETAAVILAGDEIWMAEESSASIAAISSGSMDIVPHQGDTSVRALMRLDQDRGWAVGDFGLILGTRDGGRSWRTLRGGGRSPAILFVGSQAASLPWSLIAQESLQHQRRVAVVIDRPQDEHSTSEQERLIDVTAAIGPVTTYMTHSDPQAVQKLLGLTKPAVIVLDQAMSTTQRDIWIAAAIQAGAKRVLEVGERGTQTVHVDSAIPAVGILASDVWCRAIATLAPGHLPPHKLMLNPRVDSTNDALGGDGLAGCTRSDPRYGWSRSITASRRQLQVLQARAAELTWIDSLVASARSSEEFQQLLEPVLQRMNDEDCQTMFARLVVLTATQARSDLYVMTLELLVDRLERTTAAAATADKDLLRLARLRLASIRTSAEWRQTFGSSLMRLSTSGPLATGGPPSIDLAVQWSPFQSPATSGPAVAGIQQAGGMAREVAFEIPALQLASGQSPDPHPGGGRRAMPVGLSWEFHPAVLMVARAAETDQQRLQLPRDGSETGSKLPIAEVRSTASTNLGRLVGHVSAGRWAALAANAAQPDTLRCPVAVSRPYLDGSFDEPWWQVGQPFGSEPEPAIVRMAHDDEFVYLAIDAPGLKASPHDSEVRQRDTPLDHADRYRIRIDLDRDLMTAYEFEFDGNGNTRDRCDGFVQFHPRWFIACNQTGDRTRAEIAIQKADLGQELAPHGEIWNLSLDRWNQKTPPRGLAMPNPESWRPAMLE